MSDIAFDPINPNYYLLPDGSEVIDTTKNLIGCMSQAVQYVVRSTRTDATWKDPGSRVQDLKKTIWFVKADRDRMVEDYTITGRDGEPVIDPDSLMQYEPGEVYCARLLPDDDGVPGGLAAVLPENVSDAVGMLVRLGRVDTPVVSTGRNEKLIKVTYELRQFLYSELIAKLETILDEVRAEVGESD